jgi:hypothetical protein
MSEVVAFHAKTRVWCRHTNKYAETKTQYETVSSWGPPVSPACGDRGELRVIGWCGKCLFCCLPVSLPRVSAFWFETSKARMESKGDRQVITPPTKQRGGMGEVGKIKGIDEWCLIAVPLSCMRLMIRRTGRTVACTAQVHWKVALLGSSKAAARKVCETGVYRERTAREALG